jgi:FkbM family methyltransferase
MKLRIKKSIGFLINVFFKTIRKSKYGQILNSIIVDSITNSTTKVTHGGMELFFSTPNRLCSWRAETFGSKEPETLEWIDKLDNNCVLWDIGANVGIYSVYAAKKRNAKVWAFEPSVFNLELLARNIHLNNLSENICIVPIALSDKIGASLMQLTTTDWGGALSTFGEDFGWDGEKIRKVFEYKTIGLSIDETINNLDIKNPDYIKIDVDGLEHFILKGGKSVLSKVKGVLIEINDDFYIQANECKKHLQDAGLNLKEKRHSEMIANNNYGFENSYNQIWTRN